MRLPLGPPGGSLAPSARTASSFPRGSRLHSRYETPGRPLADAGAGWGRCSPSGQSGPRRAPGRTHAAPPKESEPQMCESGSCLFVSGLLVAGGGAPVSAGWDLAVGRGAAEARQLPRSRVPRIPGTPGVPSGTCPHVPPPSHFSPQAPPQSRRLALGCPQFPRGRPGPPGAAIGTSGRAREGARGCPRAVREEGKGSREPLPLGLLELPALPERGPPPLPETCLLRREGGKCE